MSYSVVLTEISYFIPICCQCSYCNSYFLTWTSDEVDTTWRIVGLKVKVAPLLRIDDTSGSYLASETGCPNLKYLWIYLVPAHTFLHITWYNRELYIHETVHRIKFLFNNQPDTLIIQIYYVIKLYMFPASSLPIIRIFYCTFGTGKFHAGLMTASK